MSSQRNEQTVDEGRRVFLQQAGFAGFAAGFAYAFPATAHAAAELAPEALGVASTAVRAFIDAAAASGFEMHSLSVARHGRIAAAGWWAPYRAAAPQL